MSSSDKTRIITLTDRPPVRIREADWPQIAYAGWYDSEHLSQADREASIRVRKHPDGRVLCYAVYRTAWQQEDGYRGGELIEAPKGAASVPSAIRRVGERAAAFSGAPWRHLIEECIADLPAEEL